MGSARYEGGTDHLRFDKLPLEKGKKLHKYKVINSTFFQVIGNIHWRGGWRQYVFTALTHFKENIEEIDGKKYLPIDCILEIDMSRGCHKKIDEFIDKLMKEWKESLNTRKQSKQNY